MTFRVTFWGVRGSIATPAPSHVRFGGNTSCVEVRLGERTLILDAGTGIRNLGDAMAGRSPCAVHLLMSHTHWDHINGFPFYAPVYSSNCSVDIWAGHLADQGGIERVLAGQMAEPLFPVPLTALQGQVNFHDFRAGEALDLYDDVAIGTAALNHPNGATGYRIEFAGKTLCYVTDTEHVPGEPDENILGLIAGADLVIYDCTYTDAEFPRHAGWGHSTWQEGMRLCRAANAKALAIFHHDPSHDDAFLEQVEVEAKARWHNAFVAREKMAINLL